MLGPRNLSTGRCVKVLTLYEMWGRSMNLNRLLLLGAFAGLALAQSPAGSPVFDAASVRIHKAGGPEEGGPGSWVQTSPGGVTMRNAKLVWCVGWAYDQKDWLISGPEWITSERYDIFARTERAAPLAELKLMLRTLLTERFRLVLHHETKDFAVAVLVLGKNGPRNLTPATVPGPPDGPRPLGGKGPSSLVYRSVSMAAFAERLGVPPPMGIGERVVDATGLTGVYDITLKVNSETFSGGRDEFADFLKGMIEQQLGLSIDHRKMPLDALVIEQGDRVPIEN
jgi:uncharacterized protein (TIGR03435 family)